MAVPKTFVGGERLFATDLNDNFDDLDSREIALAARTTALENATLSVTTAGSNTIALDFSNDGLVNRTANGNVTITGSNYTEGKSIAVRIVASGGNRNLSFPADWKFIGLKPTSIANGKTGVLAVTCFTNAATGAVAAWAVEP
jgi:hypothetical protein